MAKVTAFWAAWTQAQWLIKRDVENEIFRIAPFKYPLSSILTNISISDAFWWSVKSQWINKKTVAWFKHEFFEKEYVIPSTTLATKIDDATTTTVSVAAWTWKNYVQWDVIRVIDWSDATWQTYEQMLVNSVSWDDLTVTRWLWDKAALGSIDAGSSITKIATAFWEWSSAPEWKVTQTTTKECYIQLFRTSAEVTEEATLVEMEAWKAWEDEKMEAAIRHAIDIETALWFSEAWALTDINGQPWHTMWWIVPELRKANLIDVITWPLTEDKFYDFLDKAFEYGSQTKLFFVSWSVEKAIAQFSSDYRRTTAEESKFWVAVSEYTTPAWTIKVIRNPLFNADNWMKDAWVLLDVTESLEYLTLAKWWATIFEEHNQVNWAKVKKWDVSTRCWLQIKKIKYNRMIVVS